MDFICFINMFYRYGKKLLEEMLSDKNLNMQELIVLLLINESKGIFQSKLLNFTALDKGNFSKFLRQLENKDLIYRVASEEMIGQNMCYLTKNGKKLIPHLKDTLDKWQNSLLENIENEKVENFNKVSKSISENLIEKLKIKW
ncbi:MarR family transcriptional regulator [Helcococcus ovis]|uniref:MarR family transcriptional regulator n=1 Tax=Helcococcus ovis TaxID=72026 RepID=A0A4R9C3F8_9FIRM|nr:MarR family transcriptional regulator [Helcococcus ovis]TFF64017.1 MarR family transcriptional regulator [Helcococcus ovis]TFF65970.1 MarR family transcriptional regulator [Helcococcus ovis]